MGSRTLLLGLVVEEAQGARMPASPVGVEVAPAEGVGAGAGDRLGGRSAVCSDGLSDPPPESVPALPRSADGVGLLAGTSFADAGVSSGRSQSTPPASSTSGVEWAAIALGSAAGGR